jgi:hypothetical protein
MEGGIVRHNFERDPPRELGSNFNCIYMARSSLTYIPGFSVQFSSQPIYTDYAN